MSKRKIDKTPATSEGARYERSALRNVIRRRLREFADADREHKVLKRLLDWVLARQKRYDNRPGGL